MASGTSAGRALPLQQILTLLSTADLDEAKKASGENESDSLDFAEAIPYVLILMDEFLIYTYWNKAAEDLTGVPADQAIGRSFYEIFPQARGTVAETVYEEVWVSKTLSAHRKTGIWLFSRSANRVDGHGGASFST